ncbi:MAG: hypothetical protein RH860_01675 [Cytophagales bacterium]
MLTELEIESIIEDDTLREKVYKLKKRFLQKEAPFMEISDQDFLGLIFMMPSLKIALADGKISFFEERRLQRKARSYSKGKFWLKKDPVSSAMMFLIKKYDLWEEEFFEVLKSILKITFQHNTLFRNMLETGDVSSQDLKKDLLNAPVLFTRMLTSFFMNHDDELIQSKNISRLQFETIVDIGNKLELNSLPLFKKFIATYSVKK